MDLEIFVHAEDSENLSPQEDLEIFTLSKDFDNLSPRVDLEIFLLAEDFEDLSPRVDIEIFAGYLNVKWGYSPTRDNNNVGPLTDL
uniref:Uncharacterized protein n=1 Tax=Vespula pensylvanica TaxID=30213 RepID=A0A834U5L3_VESPE|nr:hypothetical protein H0235_011878 [Vespula pensylvanica]